MTGWIMNRPFLWAHNNTGPQTKVVQPKAAVCHECGGYFTLAGLRMHENTAKCKLAKIAKPLSIEAEVEYNRVKASSKHVVVKNVALAISRRGLAEVCGLEKAGTKLMHTDMECYILDQYWVHEWVYLIWNKYNEKGYTRQAYQLFENLGTLSEEDRESEIGMLILSMYG